LHVLSTPPAFVLSQDQTLRRKPGHHRRAMMAFDRDASRRAESLDCEALAPSDGANTIRILTVRFVIQRPHRSRSLEAVARTRSLVLSSVFKERLAPSARALDGALVPVRAPFPARIGRAGRRDNLTAAPEAVNLRPVFPGHFSGTGHQQGFRPPSDGPASLRPSAPNRTSWRMSPRGVDAVSARRAPAVRSGACPCAAARTGGGAAPPHRLSRRQRPSARSR
jgi:hypothetical protein